MDLNYVINHVFLPPKLPQEDDYTRSKARKLIGACHEALKSFAAFAPSDRRFHRLSKMCNIMLTAQSIQQTMSNLETMDPEELLAFHIHAQNAGLIIRKAHNEFIFESFELLATTDAVTGCKGRLIRTFPGPAIAVNANRVTETSFRKEILEGFLEKLDMEPIEQACPTSRRGKSVTIESRQSADPIFVTELLMGILRGVGRPVEVERIHKRTRDDVLWRSCMKPWRRSPDWLLLRVTLQTTLLGRIDGQRNTSYKSFMVFFMSEILRVALEAKLPSELLFIMMAKIARRIAKLEPLESIPWLKNVQQVMDACHEELVERWETHQETGRLGLIVTGLRLPSLSFTKDTILSLSALRPYISNLQARTRLESADPKFVPSCIQRINIANCSVKQAVSIFDDANANAFLHLLDVEAWVQEELNSWVEIHFGSEGHFKSLVELVYKYMGVACVVYEENPEDISIMLLTILDLWVAVDKFATIQEPLLKEYDACFPPTLFAPLLLPKKQQMERLATIEEYLSARKNASIPGFPSIFTEMNTPSSFPVRYFNQSSHHQTLKRKIETAATEARAKKKAEYAKKYKECNDKQKQSDDLEHTSITRMVGRGRRRHQEVYHNPRYCRKCVLVAEAQAISIDVHEWPLPGEPLDENSLEAKSAVFELSVPMIISQWRDLTYHILVEVCSPKQELVKNNVVYPLQRFDGLSGFKDGVSKRLEPCSTIKSWRDSHYYHQKVLLVEQCCVSHALQYSMYDSDNKRKSKDFLNHYNIKQKCTFKLPPGPISTLQYAVTGTDHTSNEVIAKQNQCPDAFNFHEYYAFGTLRAGDGLQWRNIARELASGVLNLGNEETALLISQAAWEVGQLGQSRLYRQAHLDLEELEFGSCLLGEIERTLTSTEMNWQGARTARILISLATRVLSMSPHEKLQLVCLTFLNRARQVTYKWLSEILQLLHDTKNEKELALLNDRVLELSLTCHGTFEIDRHHLARCLEMQENIIALTQCMVIIHDRCPSGTTSLPQYLQKLLRRQARTAHLIEPLLRQGILRERNGLDSTIQYLWAGYRPSTQPWIALPTPNERWLMTKTAENGRFSSAEIHFNVLDGTLLVMGRPLARLSSDYETHELYRRIFGEKVLDVLPSNMNGMLFQASHEIEGWQVHFAMYDGKLIVRARKGEQVCEIIPTSVLAGDFPGKFISDYVHWLDVTTEIIEWRPLSQIWTPSGSNWHTSAPVNHEKVLLVQGKQQLVDMLSPTMDVISSIFRPMDDTKNMHVSFAPETGILEIRLPRFNLDFFVPRDSQLLQSKQFRGMVVDGNQTFGSLTGLLDKLVLCDPVNESRIVLVPYGNADLVMTEDHVKVRIKKATHGSLTYHKYLVDTRLGQLVDNRDLLGHFFRLYLHALTSFCLPDHLTGRTGTEEALSGLKAALSFSFLELNPEEFAMLENIKNLAPSRDYYPPGKTIMQSVDWANIPQLSQHEHFSRFVDQIFSWAKELVMFKERDQELPVSNPRSPPALLEKALLRNSTFRVHQFGAEDFTTKKDSKYESRDHPNLTRESKACHMTRLVDGWSSHLRNPLNLSDLTKYWTSVPGSNSPLESDIGFNSLWLTSASSWLEKNWCALHKRLSRSIEAKDKYKLMLFISTLAYSANSTDGLPATLLALATARDLQYVHVPDWTAAELSKGYAPVRSQLDSIFNNHVRSFEESQESSLPELNDGESEVDLEERRRKAFNEEVENCIKACVDHLLNQWPSPMNLPATFDGGRCNAYIEVTKAAQEAAGYFEHWHRNLKFRDHYIRSLQAGLSRLSTDNLSLTLYSFDTALDGYTSSMPCFLTFTDLLQHSPPLLEQPDSLVLETTCTFSQTKDHSKIEMLVEEFSDEALEGYEQQFLCDLHGSIDALRGEDSSEFEFNIKRDKSRLVAYTESCRSYLERAYASIIQSIYSPSNSTYVQEIARKAHLLPRASPKILLSQLSRSQISSLPTVWKTCFISYGLAITAYQRSERLLASVENLNDLRAELLNEGHRDWQPAQHPDWLLLEIENNILMRNEQSQIAQQMVRPSSGSNSLMQLNMGLGKSSVIVPATAATLADGTMLVRIIVLRPLSKQMFNILLQKLGGMLDRRVFYLPISRSLELNSRDAQQFRKLYEECKDCGGVLLIQPEHILSFELMGLDQSLSAKPEVGRIMIETQRWLDKNSRDILDESDEILTPRFELIYTMGTQRSIDFGFNRWNIIQEVLGMFSDVIQRVINTFPRGLEYIPAIPGGFPRLRILNSVAGDEMLLQLAREICEKGVAGVPIWKLSKQNRDMVFEYLINLQLPESDFEPFKEKLFEAESMRLGLLLLRGLFACGILRFTLSQKRWRVNFGLDQSRTMLAVPYQAKDTPTPRSEFSHPDTSIVLTCLSYYYGGLSDEQIFTCFDKLLSCKQAQEDYNKWTSGLADFDTTFKSLSGINLSNTVQCTTLIFPKLRYSKGIIDFYMANIVFPKEMKEFPQKISSSGWDIAKEKVNITTGFSGTNDSQYILPNTINQCDLPQLLSTNAAVLDWILRSENSFDRRLTSQVEIFNADVLLNMAIKSEPPVRVILDVGAQVLELRNEEMAKKWLLRSSTKDIQAVIFFDDDNNLTVLDRDGLKELLSVSPFLNQMDQCLVFLDEAHTRGTDLKLPTNYRAIVTLGPDLTKDRLVQACMRMRKLGKGQSVVLCGPLEVQQKILEASRKPPNEYLEVADVLKWTIRNTWNHTRKCMPLWANQGVRHHRRLAVISDAVTDSVLEPEAQSLEQRYGLGSVPSDERLLLDNEADRQLSDYQNEIDAIRKKCREFGLTSFSEATLHEEQERELQPEQEREQQIERAPAMKPYKHNIHHDIQSFVMTGKCSLSSPAFQPAFQLLHGTSAVADLDLKSWPRNLLMTTDFATTVVESGSAWLSSQNNSSKQAMDFFLRPVQWVLSSRITSYPTELILVSPYEANKLMPIIRNSKKVTLHVYAPRLSLSYPTLERLLFCALPPLPGSWSVPSPIATSLNIFSGQLYFADMEKYFSFCHLLGVSYVVADDEVNTSPDGFMTLARRNRLSNYNGCVFTKSPIALLQRLFEMRRKGQDFSSSHMGKILHGELLKNINFDK